MGTGVLSPAPSVALALDEIVNVSIFRQEFINAGVTEASTESWIPDEVGHSHVHFNVPPSAFTDLGNSPSDDSWNSSDGLSFVD